MSGRNYKLGATQLLSGRWTSVRVRIRKISGREGRFLRLLSQIASSTIESGSRWSSSATESGSPECPSDQ